MKISKEQLKKHIQSIEFMIRTFKSCKVNGIEVNMQNEDGGNLSVDEVIEMYERYLKETLNFNTH